MTTDSQTSDLCFDGSVELLLATQEEAIAPLFYCDAYKLGHRQQYPDGITSVYSNYTNRGSRIEGVTDVVHFGLQAALQKYFIDEWAPFFAAHEDQVAEAYEQRVADVLGPNTVGSGHIRALHRKGYLPLRFCAAPEGSLIPLRVPSFTFENTDPEFFWLTNYVETVLSASVWQPSTSATIALQFRRLLDEAAERTSSAPELVDWQAHDFSFRGMSSVESAQASGAGHLLSFTGTDTLAALGWINRYYAGENGLVGGSVPACYDDQTEVLTENGFKLFADLADGEKVAQYHPDGSIDFVEPLEVFEDPYRGEMITFSGGRYRYVDAVVTPNHRMVTMGADGVVGLSEASDGLKGRRYIPAAGKAVGSDLTEMSPLDRLEIAFQADGSYASNAHRYSGVRAETVPVRFNLKKERKKDRLRKILADLGYEYTETESESRSGYSHFWVKCPADVQLHKQFDWIPYARVSSEWAQQFIEEASYWDGTRHKGSMQYSSADPSNAEAVSVLGVLAGYRTHRSTYKDPRSTRQTQHMVSCTYTASAYGTESIDTGTEFYDGTVYCVSVPTKMLVVRRNGDAMVCGNTEHSVMCAGIAETSEQDTFDRLLDIYPTGILSVVSDTFDFWGVLTNILPALKDKIMSRDGKLVIRPDSGDPADIICGTASRTIATEYNLRSALQSNPNLKQERPEDFGAIELLWDLFGGTVNEKGYRELDSHIGLIYGDSITLERARDILVRLERKRFASTNMVFGAGSFLYQYNTRDTFMSAIKATQVVIDGERRDIQKSPKTDSGTKKSATGRLAVLHKHDGTPYLVEQATPEQEAQSLLQPVWEDGKFLRKQSLADVRATLKRSTEIAARAGR